MRWIRFIILLFIFQIVNASNLMNYIALPWLNVGPDLLLIMLVFVAFNAEGPDAIIASFMIGFAADLTGKAMGPYTLVYGLIGSGLSLMQSVTITKQMLQQAVTIFIVSLGAIPLANLLVSFKTGEAPANLIMVTIGTSFYCAIIGPFVWALLSMLTGWLATGNNNRGYSRSAARNRSR
jgi:rod shape-determining protein MreD